MKYKVYKIAIIQTKIMIKQHISESTKLLKYGELIKVT